MDETEKYPNLDATDGILRLRCFVAVGGLDYMPKFAAVPNF